MHLLWKVFYWRTKESRWQPFLLNRTREQLTSFYFVFLILYYFLSQQLRRLLADSEAAFFRLTKSPWVLPSLFSTLLLELLQPRSFMMLAETNGKDDMFICRILCRNRRPKKSWSSLRERERTRLDPGVMLFVEVRKEIIQARTDNIDEHVIWNVCKHTFTVSLHMHYPSFPPAGLGYSTKIPCRLS
jgi:hypothetical protein